MTAINRNNEETLFNALDQLADEDALSKKDSSSTSHSLLSLEKFLCMISLGSQSSSKPFADIAFPTENDMNFSWYMSVQSGFQSNVATHLLTFLRRSLAQLATTADKGEQRQIRTWICQALNLLQGTLLLHPQSRSLFTRQFNMLFLLKLFDVDDEEIHLEAMQAIVAALVDRPANLRTFEDSRGLKSVSELFLRPQTSHKVKVKVLEFLYFYLIPEQSQAGEHAEIGLRTTEQKQRLLGRYFSNIEALVKDLNDFKPFGDF